MKLWKVTQEEDKFLKRNSAIEQRRKFFIITGDN